MKRYSDAERRIQIWEMVSPEPNSGCWLWDGACNPGGYGNSCLHGKVQNAHRVSYQLFVGEIPTGMDLDHLCRVRCCVNPAHLEPVTRSKNLKRGDTGENVAKHQLSKTHCPQGHPYSGDNLYISPNGGRNCRTCSRERAAALAALAADAPRLKRVNAAMYEALKGARLALNDLIDDGGALENFDNIIAQIDAALASAEHQENET